MEEVEIIALLIKMRKEKNISPSEMALSIGVSLDQYYKYERMDSKLKLETFLKALSALKIDIETFFAIDSNITKEEVKSIDEKLNEVLKIVNSKS